MKAVTTLIAALAISILSVPLGAAETGRPPAGGYELNDSHFHLTNYERIFDKARVQVRAWEAANFSKK